MILLRDVNKRQIINLNVYTSFIYVTNKMTHPTLLY